MGDPLCKAFIVTNNTTFRCAYEAGHYPSNLHGGPGAATITYASGPAPFKTWRDGDAGSNGTFRQPDDYSGKTPFDGDQVIPGDSTIQ